MNEPRTSESWSRRQSIPALKHDPEIVRLFCLLYPTTPTNKLADAIGISIGSAYQMARKLGLYKSDDYLSLAMVNRFQTFGVGPSQYKKGRTPWNKGFRYPEGCKTKEAQFKPGHIPATTKPIGSYRIVADKSGRKYAQRKVSLLPGSSSERWKSLHRVIWEEKNGPIPDGYLVVFKAGVSMAALEEIALDQLECISRSEYARKNNLNNKYPPGLVAAMRVKAALTRFINRKEKENG